MECRCPDSLALGEDFWELSAPVASEGAVPWQGWGSSSLPPGFGSDTWEDSHGQHTLQRHCPVHRVSAGPWTVRGYDRGVAFESI